ncbi:MAG: hydrolase TatD [Sulfurospirillum sp.]|nr:MAG: hydrolase TatD [Sulfurospirillum sp.]
MIIDTHCHLNDKRFEKDLDQVIERAFDAGVKGMIIPGADPAELPKAIEIAEEYENIYFAVGVHPYDREDFDLTYLEKHITHPKCIAVGECGLDYFRLPEDPKEKEAEKAAQKEIFRQQIDLAKRYKKPLIIHIRDASKDSLDTLLEEDASKVGGVLHCYNASPLLLELNKHGFYYGIGGVVTFKNAKKLVEILPEIPLEKLLIETDAPYLTPHPHRGERNEPFYTTLVADKMSEILDIERSELEDIVLANTRRLFKTFF